MVVVRSCREMLGKVPKRAQHLQLVGIIKLGTLMGLPVINRRKVGMTSNQHGPYVRGYTRVTMGGTEGSHLATGRGSRNPFSVRIGVWNPTP